ncbi:DUF2085 domain-containing protein [Methanobrevibacter sp.]|uniref:DUF2085 domain-containing protein n=1 Tax=Methanobrevibacter sp. TaxID=66852 RepID=UPI00388E3067
MNVLNLVCHRMPERSFFIGGHQFPVCARCTGFYITLILYFIYAYFFFVDYTPFLIALAVIFLIPAILDGLTQLLTDSQSNNALRFLTGLLGGLGLGILIKALKYFMFLKLGGI